MLANEAKVFRKGGSQHTVYTITPEIASDVNEFVFDIEITLPQEKSLRQAHTGFINKAIKLHLKVEVSYLKLFLILQSYYILKKQNNIIHIRFASEFIREFQACI